MGYFLVVHHPSAGTELRVCHRPGPLILRKITTVRPFLRKKKNDSTLQLKGGAENLNNHGAKLRA